MIIEVKITNFKRFDELVVPFAPTTILVGPNNGGKTTALQALMIWQLALQKWANRRQLKDEAPKRKAPAKRPGIGINVQEFIFMQIGEVYELWRDLVVYEEQNKPSLIKIIVKGISALTSWECGMEFQFRDAGQVLVRPVKNEGEGVSVPQQALDEVLVSMTAIHAMLSKDELLLQPEAVDHLVATGRISDGLRNMLFHLDGGDTEPTAEWLELAASIKNLFSVELLRPIRLPNSELQVFYTNTGKDRRGKFKGKMNLSTAGSGFLQTLLLLTLFYSRKATIFLLDEPDAHLETIRQREIYRLLKSRAAAKNIQIIMASHSEQFMEEAIDTDSHLIALIDGKSRIISTQHAQKQAGKSLSSIPAAHYYDSTRRPLWLYLEDYTDLEILKAWATQMNHQALQILQTANLYYLRGNDVNPATQHFQGLKFVYPELKGIVITDRLDVRLPNLSSVLPELQWRRREIENYLLVWSAMERTFWQEAESNRNWDPLNSLDLFKQQHAKELKEMLTTNFLVSAALEQPDHPDLINKKGSEEVLAPFFKQAFARFGIYNTLAKGDFYKIAAKMKKDEIHADVIKMLDDILRILSS